MPSSGEDALRMSGSLARMMRSRPSLLPRFDVAFHHVPRYRQGPPANRVLAFSILHFIRSSGFSSVLLASPSRQAAMAKGET